ncbi:MAG: hypothetical protein V1827_06040 [Candidatus Micrarchaeota archaeon]
MHRRVMALALAFMFLFQFGCVSVDISQKVERDGSSFIEDRIDISRLESLGTLGASDICDKIASGEPEVGCSLSDDILTINKTIRPSDGLYYFNRASEFPYATYTLEVREAPSIISAETAQDAGLAGEAEDPTDFKDPSAKPTAAMLRAAGVRMTYEIEMPGELLEAQNGEIVTSEAGKKVARYDVVRLMDDGQYVVVRSKELDMPAILMVVGAAVLLIGGIIVAAVLLKAMKKPPAPQKRARR